MLGFLEALGTGNGLLRYGVHLHSEALGTGNDLLLMEWGSGVLQWEASSCWENV